MTAARMIRSARHVAFIREIKNAKTTAGKPYGKDLLGDLHFDERIILKVVIK
jgi:hypothetical protein